MIIANVRIRPRPGMLKPRRASGLYAGGISRRALSVHFIKVRSTHTVKNTGIITSSPVRIYFLTVVFIGRLISST
jgi:hypothetical protein